jgi:hypothetical protein
MSYREANGQLGRPRPIKAIPSWLWCFLCFAAGIVTGFTLLVVIRG